MLAKSMFISFGLGLSLLNCGIAQALPKTTPPNLVAQGYNEREFYAPASDSVKIRGAVVNSDGTLARSLGAISSSLLATGAYEVVFPRDVSNCIYNATPGVPGLDDPQPGEISVGLRRTNSRAVFIATFDSSGQPSNNGFHLTVTCPANLKADRYNPGRPDGY
ncbi:hypothetical protein OGM63_06655 [Plectonema radiosum NIES-515]|uniref:Uncharacterized protein n=1 Tax=Plectonema radiosum NIES-515 TaxID=2986073 RepID=A0ABT3AVQ7_9CYAN|nr:hypothetical protein [Plectonema radiosum]MCV3213206.1 hypothetical protein [Plectonema radiosum NIES-515]